jgi:LmbE family N-acetylglucosaminyl deacetylase
MAHPLAEAERIVVLSPHLDDAVLSVGALLAGRARDGARVTVVTVLAGDPGSEEPASDWDARAGFPTAGAAARARREEDRRACSRIGAEPVWLGHAFRGDEPPDEAAARDDVAAAVAGADAVLVPGFPLEHPEHAWLHGLVRSHDDTGLPISFYAEQPYVRWSGARPPEAFAPVRPALRDRAAKARAVACYASQLELLGRGGRLAVLHELRRAGDELVAPGQER